MRFLEYLKRLWCRENENRHHPNPTSRKNDLRALLQKHFPYVFDEKAGIQEEYLEKSEATIIKDKTIHEAWHTLFSNKFVWEAISDIQVWFSNDAVDFRCFLSKKQEWAWNFLFGNDADGKEATEIIKREWSPEFPPIEEIMEKTK